MPGKIVEIIRRLIKIYIRECNRNRVCSPKQCSRHYLIYGSSLRHSLVYVLPICNLNNFDFTNFLNQTDSNLTDPG
uniref:Uncharacterized protein n=1 Tax=Nelumbo nucifera TaxID=4432 RepID=A0A822Y2D2_NELNU|nr:TPA_asm: hypothetical protein HUJ06_028248 [Nelumbo nucifera]